MKTFKAKAIIVPSDLAERYDKRAGYEAGFLRNTLLDAGRARELDDEVLAIGLMPLVKTILDEKNLPDDSKPLSIERLSNVLYVTMFAYCVGTMYIDEDGDVGYGEGIEDARTALEVSLSDKIKFANGKTMDVKEFMHRLQVTTAPENIGGIYKDVIKRHGFKKNVDPKQALDIARVSLIASKKLMK